MDIDNLIERLDTCLRQWKRTKSQLPQDDTHAAARGVYDSHITELEALVESAKFLSE